MSHQPRPVPANDRREYVAAPSLLNNQATRLRLAKQLQAIYEPVIDEAMDPRIAELLGQLDKDRKA